MDLGTLELLAGAAAIAAGLYTWRRNSEGEAAPRLSNLSIGATLAFALVSTVSDLPTAIPYFAAASQIAAADIDPFTRYAWLVAYNLVYIAPLVAMLALRVILGARAEPALSHVRLAVDWSISRLLPPALLLAGTALLIDGSVRLAAALS